TLGIGVAGLGLVSVIAHGVGTAVLIRVGLGVSLRVGFDRVAISVSGAVVTLGRVGDDFPVAPVGGDFIIGVRQVGQVDVIGIRCLGGHGLLSRVVCQRRGGGHEDCGGEQGCHAQVGRLAFRGRLHRAPSLPSAVERGGVLRPSPLSASSVCAQSSASSSSASAGESDPSSTVGASDFSDSSSVASDASSLGSVGSASSSDFSSDFSSSEASSLVCGSTGSPSPSPVPSPPSVASVMTSPVPQSAVTS